MLVQILVNHIITKVTISTARSEACYNPTIMNLLNSFQNPISELIHQRYSCRTYNIQPICSEDISNFTAFVNDCILGPSTSTLKFSVVAASEDDAKSLKALGTYGFIKNPTGFVIGVVQDQPRALEDFGYLMELIVLRAVDLGIGSCWLGGTFTKSRFAKLIHLGDGETIPSVISIGYPADQKAWMDRISRTYAGADRRLPRRDLFFSDRFDNPLTAAQAGLYSEALELVRLAPSASNKQPWRILQKGKMWHFYLQRTKKYPSPVFGLLLGLADLQRVDMGIAMAHFELSALDQGLTGNWVVDDPNLILDKPGLEYNISWLSN